MTLPNIQTAEWICTNPKCQTVNRKIAPYDSRRVRDVCISCKTKHTVEWDERPVRWRAIPLKPHKNTGS